MCESCDSGSSGGSVDPGPMSYTEAVECIRTFQEAVVEYLGYDLRDEQLAWAIQLQRERIISAIFQGPTIDDIAAIGTTEDEGDNNE